MLEAPAGKQSLYEGAGAALVSLVNKCHEFLSVSAADAAFNVLQHRVSTQSEPDAAALQPCLYIEVCLTCNPYVLFILTCLKGV
jgi:hypothetical protein